MGIGPAARLPQEAAGGEGFGEGNLGQVPPRDSPGSKGQHEGQRMGLEGGPKPLPEAGEDQAQILSPARRLARSRGRLADGKLAALPGCSRRAKNTPGRRSGGQRRGWLRLQAVTHRPRLPEPPETFGDVLEGSWCCDPPPSSSRFAGEAAGQQPFPVVWEQCHAPQRRPCCPPGTISPLSPHRAVPSQQMSQQRGFFFIIIIFIIAEKLLSSLRKQ